MCKSRQYQSPRQQRRTRYKKYYTQNCGLNITHQFTLVKYWCSHSHSQETCNLGFWCPSWQCTTVYESGCGSLPCRIRTSVGVAGLTNFHCPGALRLKWKFDVNEMNRSADMQPQLEGDKLTPFPFKPVNSGSYVISLYLGLDVCKWMTWGGQWSPCVLHSTTIVRTPALGPFTVSYTHNTSSFILCSCSTGKCFWSRPVA